MTRGKDATGFLHISDRLLADELSRVEAARGALYPSSNIEYFAVNIPLSNIIHVVI